MSIISQWIPIFCLGDLKLYYWNRVCLLVKISANQRSHFTDQLCTINNKNNAEIRSPWIACSAIVFWDMVMWIVLLNINRLHMVAEDHHIQKLFSRHSKCRQYAPWKSILRDCLGYKSLSTYLVAYNSVGDYVILYIL